jgi:DNA-binding GntR family transcriptional regulator
MARPIVDEIAEILEEAIISGELAPGTAVPQRQLAEELGVSRTPVREALRQVAARGLVTLEGKRGALVRKPRHEELAESYVIRAELEGLAARLAAERITRTQLKELRAAERRIEELTKAWHRAKGVHEMEGLSTEYARANLDFHDIIYDAAHSPLLKETVQRIRLSSHVIWKTNPELERLFEMVVEQHQGIVEALAERDPNAGELAKQHILDSLLVVEEMFANVLPPTRRLLSGNSRIPLTR